MSPRTRAQDRQLVRIGTHILISKMMLATGLTEEEIVRAVVWAAQDGGKVPV